MGYHKDLGTGIVAGIHKATGYPMDQWGHLLRPQNAANGIPEKNWDVEGTELCNMTNPYGFLEYACGSGNDFVCFDAHKFHVGPGGEWIELAATANGDNFIKGLSHEIMPVRSTEECRSAVVVAQGMVDRAEQFQAEDPPVRHSIKGWNQHPMFFRNSVFRELFPWIGKEWTSRMLRMNTKRVRRYLDPFLAVRRIDLPLTNA